jgi:cytosine/adenosine deaminase-related metal-dependent hydrolase
MEYVQRLSGELRGVNVHAQGRTGPALMQSGSLSGAESLGIDAGLIRKGRLADFTAIDLAHPTLRHVDSEDLLEAIVLGTGNEAVVGTCVGGRWLRGGPPEVQ